MTSLDELLALLPDNDQGEISAADMREIVTALWDEGSTGAELAVAYSQSTNARIDALEASSDVLTFASRWRADKSMPAAKGTGVVSCDTRDFSTATVLTFDDRDLLDTDVGNVITAASQLKMQGAGQATEWVAYDVTSAAQLSDGTYVVPVSVSSSSGSINGNDVVVVVMFVSAS